MSTTQDQPQTIDHRKAFLAIIRQTAEAFAAAAPLTVPAHEVKRHIERILLQFRAMAADKPELYACTPQSIARAIALSALSGLEVSGSLPGAYLIPRKKNFGDGQSELRLEWQISWRGYQTLAARAGATCRAVPVFEGEFFYHEEGLEVKLQHRPDMSLPQTWDALLCVYVVASFGEKMGNLKAFELITKEQIEARRAKAQSRDIWNAWPIEMARKTAFRYAIARGLVPMDAVASFAHDEENEERVVARDVLQTVEPPPKQIEAPQDIETLADRLERGRQREPVRAQESEPKAPSQAAKIPQPEKPSAHPDAPPKAPPKPRKPREEKESLASLQDFVRNAMMTLRGDQAGRIGAIARTGVIGSVSLMTEAQCRFWRDAHAQVTSEEYPALAAAVEAAWDKLSEDGINDVLAAIKADNAAMLALTIDQMKAFLKYVHGDLPPEA